MRLAFQNRSGFTMIEMAMVAGVIAILAGIALPNIDFQRYRVDGNARNVQNKIMGAQILATQRNRNVILTFVYVADQFRTVVDNNGDGLYGSGEPRTWKGLNEKMKFAIPATTIDGASPYYATGPGIYPINGVAASNGVTCNTCPTLTLKPNGSASGDAVIYLYSGRSTRKEDYRAIQLFGATGKMRIWRMMPNGTWKLSNQV